MNNRKNSVMQLCEWKLRNVRTRRYRIIRLWPPWVCERAVLVYILTHGTLPRSVTKIDITHTFWLFEMSFSVIFSALSASKACVFLSPAAAPEHPLSSGLLQSTQPLGRCCGAFCVCLDKTAVFILLEVFQTLPPPREAGLALSDCYQTEPRHSVTGTG